MIKQRELTFITGGRVWMDSSAEESAESVWNENIHFAGYHLHHLLVDKAETLHVKTPWL